jgi:UPF0176 protein
MQIVVATYYHFFACEANSALKTHVLDAMHAHGVLGTVLLTPEGVNSTIAGPRAGIDGFLAFLKSEVVGADFEHKESICAEQPFQRAKVKLKPETISLGEPACPVDGVGTYLDAAAWNDLLDDPDAVIIDTRNDYEVHLGTFRGAINPNIATFRQLPEITRRLLGPDKTRKIGTFCTGGIRCEKFTAWLLAEGYTNVYHLKGGILKYFEETTPATSKWLGECFVFDERIAVDQDLNPTTTASMCPVCSATLTPEDRAHPAYVAGVHCASCDMADPYTPEFTRAEAATGRAHANPVECA